MWMIKSSYWERWRLSNEDCTCTMATTGCASAGSSTLSSMKQLHALHQLACRSPSSLPLPHSCKLVFLFYLPSRLNPITSLRHRLPLSPPFCGHGELEIVSVKELADGFLHFSFGAPASSSNMDDLSSSCGEHLAEKLSVPRRLPSKFSKKLPIPVAADRRRRRQRESSSKEGSGEAIPTNVKEAMKFSTRPKSSFLKRSPIPKRYSEHRLVRERVSNGTALHVKNMMPQETKAGSITVNTSMRPTSTFVRKSPIPAAAVKLKNRHEMPSASPDLSPSNVGNTAPTIQESLSAGSASRPKSNFIRRSPNSKVQLRASSTGRQSPATPLNPEESTNTDSKAKNQNTPESLPHLTVDLEQYKLPELKDLAKSKGVKGYYKLKKAELLNVLKSLDS